MFAEMRRQDRLLTREEANEILGRCEYGVLSTLDESGYPCGVPFNYAYQNGKIYIHCAHAAGRTTANLKKDARVCFTVVGKTEVMPEKFGTKYESVVVFGSARELEAEEKQAALEGFIAKYSADFHEGGMTYIANAFAKTGVFEIVPDHITGKAKRQ